MTENARRIELPPSVEGRAKAAGEIGLAWIERLPRIISYLEKQLNITVGDAISGGSHAFVAGAAGENGEEYILKIEVPDFTEEEFLNSIRALIVAEGKGYPKIHFYSAELMACLMERLGCTLKSLSYPPKQQMEIICTALKGTWQIPVKDSPLPFGSSYDWFADFIPTAWEKLKRPCPEKVITAGLEHLTRLKVSTKPEEYVLVHGDAHNNNMLRTADGGFKLIDPDGLIFEKSYDLGVLMREWPEELHGNTKAAFSERADFLSSLTGVNSTDIYSWGYLQMLATSLILLQIGQKELGSEMLNLACKLAE